MRGTRPDCSARAESGDTATAPPSSVIKSRRFMARRPQPLTIPYHTAGFEGCVVHHSKPVCSMDVVGHFRLISATRAMFTSPPEATKSVRRTR